jgi:hypothetical protein
VLKYCKSIHYKNYSTQIKSTDYQRRKNKNTVFQHTVLKYIYSIFLKDFLNFITCKRRETFLFIGSDNQTSFPIKTNVIVHPI